LTAILVIITGPSVASSEDEEERKLLDRIANPEKFEKFKAAMDSRMTQQSKPSHVITEHIQPKLRLTPVQVPMGGLPGPSILDDDPRG